jgi:hypothetical protein
VTHRILLPEIRQIQGRERNLESGGVQNPQTSGGCGGGWLNAKSGSLAAIATGSLLIKFE